MSETRGSRSAEDYRDGPIAAFLTGSPVFEVGPWPAAAAGAGEGHPVVLAAHRLQEIADYRAAIQAWFGSVKVGGHLVIVVPHAFLYERQSALPSRINPGQHRLYTPRLLLSELEEALAPNTYRVRWLGDDDAGYDYTRDVSLAPVGRHDILLVIERIAPPAWGLEHLHNTTKGTTPDFAFEPSRTRVERPCTVPAGRILILKLDHLGDFIMGIPSLERARKTFPTAEITLVVGSWNETLALDLGLFDHVLRFDVFPRNSSEQKVDVVGKTAQFDELVTRSYDLAIDLRTDHDTRFLLRNVRAAIRAGIGTRSRFDFLDIFLPADISRHGAETAGDDELPLRDFRTQDFCTRSRFKVSCPAERARHHGGSAIIYGPYRRIRAGQYILEPFIDIDSDIPGLLRYDIAIDRETIAEGFLSELGELRLRFTNEVEDGELEFRLWVIEGERPPDFSFYGARLLRQGASSVLHQAEYLSLLIELVAMRMSREGVLREQPLLPA